MTSSVTSDAPVRKSDRRPGSAASCGRATPRDTSADRIFQPGAFSTTGIVDSAYDRDFFRFAVLAPAGRRDGFRRAARRFGATRFSVSVGTERVVEGIGSRVYRGMMPWAYNSA